MRFDALDFFISYTYLEVTFVKGNLLDLVQHFLVGNDTIYCSGGADKVSGYAGNDIIHGGGGVDFIDGHLGNDTLYGDAGNDLLGGATIATSSSADLAPTASTRTQFSIRA